jgi:hypothetical protein
MSLISDPSNDESLHRLHQELKSVGVVPMGVGLGTDLSISKLRRGMQRREDHNVAFATLIEQQGCGTGRRESSQRDCHNDAGTDGTVILLVRTRLRQ